MPIKLKLDSNKIYHKEFVANKPGYDALQVDTFLDIVINDYESVENYVRSTDKEIDDLNLKVKSLNETLLRTEAENANLKARLGSIADNDDANLSNLELLKRISALERALAKAGIDPNTIE